MTVIAGILAAKDENGDMILNPDATLNFENFVKCVISQRIDRGTDAGSIAARAHALIAQSSTSDALTNCNEVANGDEVADPDSDEDDDGAQEAALQSTDKSKWLYPVVVPEHAAEGTILTVPLPGGETAYVPVPSNQEPGSEIYVPMTEVSISASVKQAASAAAAAQTSMEDSSPLPAPPSEAGNEDVESSASMMGKLSMFSRKSESVMRERPEIVKGPGTTYVENKGREYFCSNVSLSRLDQFILTLFRSLI